MRLRNDPNAQTPTIPWMKRDRESLRRELREDTYEQDGALRWKSNDAVVPSSCFKDAGYLEPKNQRAEREKEMEETFRRYREAQAKRTPEQIAEQRAEARAAMGPGVEMVNVITGETYTT